MGQPVRIHLRTPRAEHIGPVEGTRGTETSKYPEEEKSTETPLVAASERGTAQTSGVFTAVRPMLRWGCRSRQRARHGPAGSEQSRLLAEGPWNGPPQKVTDLYAKGAGLPSEFLSTTGHVKPRGKLGGPSSKATYL